jgi:hypothetical protein
MRATSGCSFFSSRAFLVPKILLMNDSTPFLYQGEAPTTGKSRRASHARIPARLGWGLGVIA